jgi:hypothetical protein
MANRETYPASQSPLQGDISGPAGATLVAVVGLQGQPISPAIPVPQDDLVFDGAEWAPQAEGNAAITLGTYATSGGQVTSKGIPVSDDYQIFVNATFVKVNGVVIAP